MKNFIKCLMNLFDTVKNFSKVICKVNELTFMPTIAVRKTINETGHFRRIEVSTLSDIKVSFISLTMVLVEVILSTEVILFQTFSKFIRNVFTIHEKGKPVVRRGRKATGPGRVVLSSVDSRVTETGDSVFFFNRHERGMNTMYYGWRKYLWFKVVALAVCAVFLFTDLSWAARNNDLKFSAGSSRPAQQPYQQKQPGMKDGLIQFFQDLSSMLMPAAHAAETPVSVKTSQGRNSVINSV